MSTLTAEIVDVSEHDYHADLVADGPTLSNSIAKVIVEKSARHARAEHPRFNPRVERKAEKKFDLGTGAHALLLEGREDAIVVVKSDAYRSDAAKAARSEAYLAGKTPILEKDLGPVQEMVAAAREQLDRHSPVPFTDGKSEKTLVWNEDGVLCRSRIDWLRDDLAGIDDYKTTSASAAPEKWGKTMAGFDGAMQVAFYLRGLRALGARQPWFRFVVQELAAPYALCVFSLSPDSLAIADAKVQYAIDTWRRCLETDVWPAYPEETCYLQAAPWEESQWLDRAARDSFSTDRRAA